MVDAEFLAHVHPKGGLRAPPDLPRHALSQVGVDALVLKRACRRAFTSGSAIQMCAPRLSTSVTVAENFHPRGVQQQPHLDLVDQRPFELAGPRAAWAIASGNRGQRSTSAGAGGELAHSSTSRSST